MASSTALTSDDASLEANKPVTMQQLSTLLENHHAKMKEDITMLVNTLSESVQASVDALQRAVSSFNKLLTETEVIVGENFERLTMAEETIKSIQTQNKLLQDHIEDLENRSRWSNFHFVNILEGREISKQLKQFIADLLMELVGPEVFNKLPLIDHIHHTGSAPERGSSKSRSFIVCFHDCLDKEKVLRCAMKNELKYCGITLRV